MPECMECGKEFKNITWTHLEKTHGMTTDEYKEKYPDTELHSKDLREQKQELMKENNPMDDPESVQKLSETNKGFTHNEETKEQISETRKKQPNKGMGKGDTHSQETIEKLKKKCANYGEDNGFYGESHTEETKKQLSEFRKKFYENNPHPAETHDNFGLSGEDNPNWKGGLSFEPYSPEFNNELKEEVREEYNRCCVVCGKHENDIRKNNMDVHHIDYDKSNNDKNNLVPLCPKCHGKTNYNRRFWEQWFDLELYRKSL